MYQKSLNESIKFLFIGQGQVDTWHHLRGLLEASSSRKYRENTFSHEPQQFRTMVRSGGSIGIIFVFLERFAWLFKNFAWSWCEIEKHAFSTPLYNFSHFFIFNPPPPPSIQLQSLVQTNYITSFIVYLDHHQLYLFSLIWFIAFGINLSKS